MSDVENSKHFLLSEQLPALTEQLEILYIKDNISGRLGFARGWPAVASWLLGTELMTADAQGARDRKARSAWEDEAEARRLDLLAVIKTLEEKSVAGGVLESGYVRQVIARYGQPMALQLYAEAIVERFSTPQAEIVAEEKNLAPPESEEKSKTGLRLHGISEKN